MDSCFVLIGTKRKWGHGLFIASLVGTHDHCVAKICNTSPKPNAHKSPNHRTLAVFIVYAVPCSFSFPIVIIAIWNSRIQNGRRVTEKVHSLYSMCISFGNRQESNEEKSWKLTMKQGWLLCRKPNGITTWYSSNWTQSRIATMNSCFDLVGSRQHGVVTVKNCISTFKK